MVWPIMGGAGSNIKDVRKPSQRGHTIDAGKGKPGRFLASQALDYRVFQKGVSRSSRKWMKLMSGNSRSVVVTRVYLVERTGSHRNNEVSAVIVLRISEYRLNRTFTLNRKKATPRSFIATSLTPPWLASGWGCRGRRPSRGRGNLCRRRVAGRGRHRHPLPAKFSLARHWHEPPTDAPTRPSSSSRRRSLREGLLANVDWHGAQSR